MTNIIENMINKRLNKAECSQFCGENVFMHVCAIIPYRTLFDIENKQYPKCNYWNEFIT